MCNRIIIGYLLFISTCWSNRFFSESKQCPANQCLIDGECYEDNTSNTSNPCQRERRIRRNICTSCHNGGTYSGTECWCSVGFTGSCCQYDIDECSSCPCEHNCHNTHGSYSCTCNSCYTQSGTRCLLQHCIIGATCYSHNTINSKNFCQWCDISSNKVAWSNRPSTVTCDDNDLCTKNDRCLNGQCVGTPFGDTCTQPCYYCDGSDCSLKTTYGFVNGQCTCKIRGDNYNHYQFNPSNKCQWCDIHDVTARSTMSWSNTPAIPCNDGDMCTKQDTCSNGQCVGTAFGHLCIKPCQYCNGSMCSLQDSFGFVNRKCYCKIAGHQYDQNESNPTNQCQWCDIFDITARSSMTWSNKPAVPCNDSNSCTKQDTCSNGKCLGVPYSCQIPPNSSCVQRYECKGDGTCEEIVKLNGTTCRAAEDDCDNVERCDGKQGECPQRLIDPIEFTLGNVTSQPYQQITDKITIELWGFNASCGPWNLTWIILQADSQCKVGPGKQGISTAVKQLTITSLNLTKDNSYKVLVQLRDFRGQQSRPICSNNVTISIPTPTPDPGTDIQSYILISVVSLLALFSLVVITAILVIQLRTKRPVKKRKTVAVFRDINDNPVSAENTQSQVIGDANEQNCMELQAINIGDELQEQNVQNTTADSNQNESKYQSLIILPETYAALKKSPEHTYESLKLNKNHQRSSEEFTQVITEPVSA